MKSISGERFLPYEAHVTSTSQEGWLVNETFHDCHSVQKMINSIVAIIRERVNPILQTPAGGDLLAESVTLAQQHCGQI